MNSKNTLEGFVRHHYNASILTPAFLDLINYPKIDKEIDGIEVSHEKIFEYEFFNDPYKKYLESLGIGPGADTDIRYLLKSNPISFAKENSQFTRKWTIRNFIRILRRLPLNICINDFPRKSELAVEVDNTFIRICPYNKDGVVTSIDPVIDLKFNQMNSDYLQLSYPAYCIPECFIRDEINFLNIEDLSRNFHSTFTPLIKLDFDLFLYVYLKHNPEIISREVVKTIPEERIDYNLEVLGGYVEMNDGTKLIKNF